MLGVNLVINPEQALVLNRIFTMYAGGQGKGTIAIQLNSEEIGGPNGPWSRYTIHEMLRNEKYRGVFVWGRTKKARNPETGRKVSRATPESQWRTVVVPECRIISDELWEAVKKRLKTAKESFRKLGGMTRTERGRTYLFSGILTCGECGGNMVICSGGGKRGYVKYGCHAHKHNGMCANKLMIRQDRLETQLLDAIERKIFKPVVFDSIIKRCEEELEVRLSEIERQGVTVSVESLKKDLEDRKRRQGRLIDAIETRGDINSLTERLRALEDEIKGIQNAISTHRPMKRDDAVNKLREQIAATLGGLKELLVTEKDISRGRAALAKHVGKLVLTPAIQDGRPIYKVEGSVSVQGDTEKCRMQLVARDGIEPPTPAFSGLSTDLPKWF